MAKRIMGKVVFLTFKMVQAECSVFVQKRIIGRCFISLKKIQKSEILLGLGLCFCNTKKRKNGKHGTFSNSFCFN